MGSFILYCIENSLEVDGLPESESIRIRPGYRPTG